MPGRTEQGCFRPLQPCYSSISIHSAASFKRALKASKANRPLSRAKQKLILVASESVFSLFSPEDDGFANSLLWKRLLHKSCTTMLWEGERAGKRVSVWGGKGEAEE